MLLIANHIRDNPLHSLLSSFKFILRTDDLFRKRFYYLKLKKIKIGWMKWNFFRKNNLPKRQFTDNLSPKAFQRYPDRYFRSKKTSRIWRELEFEGECRKLYAEIARLPEQCRKVFELIVLKDMKYKEVADFLGLYSSSEYTGSSIYSSSNCKL